jgi:hypothetical protein
MSEIIKKLSIAETIKYSNCKEIITSGLQSFIDVGDALADLRDGKLYREEYSTFEECCDAEFGITPSYARRLVAATGVIENLKSVPIGTIPENEAQARPLVGLPADKQAEAFKAATDKAASEGRKVTGADVKAAVVASRPVPPPPKKGAMPFPLIVDKNDVEVPAKLIPLWSRRQEVQDMIKAIQDVKLKIKKAKEANDRLFAGGETGRAPMDFNDIESHLDMTIADLKACYTVYVCPACKGETCAYCCGLGITSEYYFKMIPESLHPKEKK